MCFPVSNNVMNTQPATNCSERFPILNYTVSILGLEGSVVVDDPSPSDLLLSVTLTSANFPLLSVDQRYSIIITACSSFACRSPAQPLVAGTASHVPTSFPICFLLSLPPSLPPWYIVTTDTQTASAVFYSTAVSLDCSFAAGSSARGCLFVFHLTNENRSENATVYYASGDLVMFNTSCNLLTNTRYCLPVYHQFYIETMYIFCTEEHMMSRFWCMILRQMVLLVHIPSLPVLQ